MKILLKNATLLPEYGFSSRAVNVVVEDKKITEITEKTPDIQADQVIDCENNLLIPGFYNAHCHAAMTLFRGYGEDLPLQRWLEERIFPAEDRLTYESVLSASRFAIAEMLRFGVVSFSDMYMFEDATAEAVLETGIKANLSRCIVSFDPNADMKNDFRLRESLELVDRYHNADDGRLKIDLSLHAEYTNVPHACEYVGRVACERDLLMQLHLSETEKEHLDCIGRHGKTPTEFFRDLGVFDAPTLAAHCVWVTDSDIEILAQKGVTAVHNPISNLKLGSGVMPIRKMLDAGVNVAMGTDGVASNNRLDLLRDYQTAAILHKGVSHDPASVTAKELFPLITKNGAIAQGRRDCGEIRVGAHADMILLDRHAIHNVPCYD
ncbi:MAG: amidohydrolase, partial [Clostridia bacterium]|nr:amidohydrolase [Clostridia bacterium]